MDLQIIDLDSTHAAELIAFYEGLTEEARRFFAPFGDTPANAVGPHLAGAEAGSHLSLGLAEGTALRGHCFVADLRGKHPALGLGVDARYQGMGHGRRLLEHALARTEAMGVRRVTLTVVRENARAVDLYKSAGFVVKCLHTFRMTDDSFLMERIV
jgi:GNAT superfamily N-acetyltransferase